jgi:hypothetical protein
LIINPQKNLKKVLASLQIVKILFSHVLLKSSAK